ncbi:uncharacterized protein ISCGN_022542 [Ixodes scapularis]
MLAAQEHAEQPQARNSEGLCRKVVRGAFRPRRARALRIFKEGRRSRGVDFRRRSPSLNPEEFRREVVGGTTSAGGTETSPPSSEDDEGPAVSASSVQRRSAGVEPPPERRPPTPARQAPAQPSPAACRAPAPPAPEPLASKGPGTGHRYRRLWHQRRKSTSPRGGNRRSKHRTPPWLKNIRHLQRTTRLLILRLLFARVVREILQGLAPSRSDRYYMQGLALQALQEASELFVTNFLSASYLCSLHAKRKTLMRKDGAPVKAGVWRVASPRTPSHAGSPAHVWLCVAFPCPGKRASWWLSRARGRFGPFGAPRVRQYTTSAPASRRRESWGPARPVVSMGTQTSPDDLHLPSRSPSKPPRAAPVAPPPNRKVNAALPASAPEQEMSTPAQPAASTSRGRGLPPHTSAPQRKPGEVPKQSTSKGQLPATADEPMDEGDASCDSTTRWFVPASTMVRLYMARHDRHL